MLHSKDHLNFLQKEMTMACIKYKSMQSMREKQCTIVQFTEKKHEGSIFILYFNVIVERENIFSHEKKNTLMIPSFQKQAGECNVTDINVCVMSKNSNLKDFKAVTTQNSQ